MVDAMKHEDFYTSGTYLQPSVNLHLGWICRQGCYSDCMPIASQTGKVLLFFYGENFPPETSRTELLQRGFDGQFHDARYLIRLFEKSGDAFLADLNGWFSGVLVDLEQRRVLLFNDRYGMQRVYYHDDGECFYFASEAKCLLRVLPSAREFDPEAVAEQIAFNCVFGTKTLFKNVAQLPGGSCWTFDEGGQFRTARYFEPASLEATAPLESEEVFDRLRNVFLQIIPRYAESRQQVALSLTGGLDTRLIVAGLGSHGRRLRAYTFGGQHDTFDTRQSRTVAAQAQLRHEVLHLEQDFFQDFPKLLEKTVRISDGTLGAAGTHNVYLNRLARRIAPVRLTGKFGSEVLRQGRILPKSAGKTRFLNDDWRALTDAAETRVEEYRKGHPLTATLFRDIPWREHGVVAVEQSQLTLRSPFMDNDLVEVMYAAPNLVRQSKSLQQSMIHRINPELSRIFTDRGNATGRNRILVGACQALLWALFRLDYVYFFDTPGWLVRFERPARLTGLPQWATGHQKFEHYRFWYQGPLRNYVAEVLLDRQTLDQEFFDSQRLQEMVREHLSGRANHQNEISMALTLEMIGRTLVKG